MEQRDEGFLPPEPAGPEPDLGGGQQPPQQQPPQQQPPPVYQPPPAYPPPAYQPGYQQQPPPYQPPPVYRPPAPGYGWTPPPKQPDNGPALAGFIVSMVSAALWLFSAGFGTPLSIPGAIVGMVLSRRGKQKIDAGETLKHKDLAAAGWWVGLSILVLSVISTIVWVLVIVLASNSESFDDNMKHELQDSQTSGGLRLGLAAVYVGARLFC